MHARSLLSTGVVCGTTYLPIHGVDGAVRVDGTTGVNGTVRFGRPGVDGTAGVGDVLVGRETAGALILIEQFRVNICHENHGSVSPIWQKICTYEARGEAPISDSGAMAPYAALTRIPYGPLSGAMRAWQRLRL